MSHPSSRLGQALLPAIFLAASMAQAHPQEAEIDPIGFEFDADWTFAWFDEGTPPTSPADAPPESRATVRLYLIDTAISNPGGWFDRNSKLSFESSTVIGGARDPDTSSSFAHGTRMLSIIAGPETGAALGTPIEVVSYDIYPNGVGRKSNVGVIAAAVSEARLHHLLDPGTPGVICIANGSTESATSPLLQAYIESAVASGLTVVVSAGNSGGDAADYVPGAFGICDGVICVGATNQSDIRLTTSNYGASVDFYAPGKNVRTLDFDAPAPGHYDSMSGTSPATALATAAALDQLSQNPEFSPAELEASMKDSAFNSPVSLIQVPAVDSDGDGVDNLHEAFMGTDPDDLLDHPPAPSLSDSDGTLQLSFKIAASRFDPDNPYKLDDGTTWKVLGSKDRIDWRDAAGSLSIGAAQDSKIPVTFTTTASAVGRFLRLQITPAAFTGGH